jgi:hypothetical protein
VEKSVATPANSDATSTWLLPLGGAIAMFSCFAVVGLRRRRQQRQFEVIEESLDEEGLLDEEEVIE